MPTYSSAWLSKAPSSMPAPYPLLTPAPGDVNNWFDYPAKSMTASHNCFISGFNSMLAYAPHITPEKVQPFIIYCLATVDAVDHHHTMEEDYYFPALEEKLGKGALAASLAQHGEFVPQMDQFKEWLLAVQAGKEPYDGQLLVSKVNEFGDTMFKHLNEELINLESSKIRAAFTEQDIKTIQAGIVSLARKSAQLHVSLPYMLIVVNPEEPWFPPIPSVLKFAARWWFYRKHKESWEFGPCDLYGNPKVLPSPVQPS